MPRRISKHQMRLLPTVAEIKRDREKAAERAALSSIKCWQCKHNYPPALVNPHPDTMMEVCYICTETHPQFYDRWIGRRYLQERGEA